MLNHITEENTLIQYKKRGIWTIQQNIWLRVAKVRHRGALKLQQHWRMLWIEIWQQEEVLQHKSSLFNRNIFTIYTEKVFWDDGNK